MTQVLAHRELKAQRQVVQKNLILIKQPSNRKKKKKKSLHRKPSQQHTEEVGKREMHMHNRESKQYPHTREPHTLERPNIIDAYSNNKEDTQLKR